MDEVWKVKIGGWHKRRLMHSECGQQFVQGMLSYTQDEDDYVDWEVREERKKLIHILLQQILALLYVDPKLFATRRVQHHCDIYSLGLLIAEIFNRIPPFASTAFCISYTTFASFRPVTTNYRR